MAGEWAEIPLGNVITLQRGFDLPSQHRKPGKVPIVSSSGISDYHSEVGVKGPGVVTGRYGTIGQVFLIKEDYWPLNTSLWVKDFHGNDPHFASYLLRTVDFQSCSDKSSVPGVNRNDLHRIPVLLPSLAEQKAIAAVLGALDDKIELNRRMNATLEAMTRTLFQSWFVDFDPVRRNKDEGGRMKDEISALFPDSFQESELGLIPKGWGVCPLSSLTRYLSRGIGPAYLKEGGVCVLNQKCVRDHRVDFSKSRRHDADKKPVNDRALQLHDILVNSTGMGTLGRVAQVFHLPEVTIIDSHVTIVRADSVTDPFFLGINLTCREAEIEELGEGSTGQTELSRARLGQLKIITPPSELQKAFGVVVAPLLARISENDHQSRTLATLRDTLLPKLLSGELSVAGIAP
jgi:type I restriction enzyme S subunit